MRIKGVRMGFCLTYKIYLLYLQHAGKIVWNINDLRGRIHQVFERWKDGENPFGNELKVAVPHVIHDINISNVAKERSQRSSPSKH